MAESNGQKLIAAVQRVRERRGSASGRWCPECGQGAALLVEPGQPGEHRTKFALTCNPADSCGWHSGWLVVIGPVAPSMLAEIPGLIRSGVIGVLYCGDGGDAGQAAEPRARAVS